MNANGLIAPPAQPLWITTAAGAMTIFSFQQDVINHLALVAGGSYGRVFVAPNNLVQYGNIRDRLTHIETDAFVQAAMAGIPAGAFLASTAIVFDRRNASGTPSARIPHPDPNRQIFN